MNTAQQAANGAPPAEDFSKEDFYKAIAESFLSDTFEQLDSNAPPITENPETAQLLNALAEICPDFPRGEQIGKLLFMYTAGFMKGFEAGINATDAEQPAK